MEVQFTHHAVHLFKVYHFMVLVQSQNCAAITVKFRAFSEPQKETSYLLAVTSPVYFEPMRICLL